MTTIPAITDPMGKHWDQPSISEIELDDTHALMTEATLHKLANYSRTLPTGVYAGKMWRCLQDGEWWLRWFGVSDDPKFVSNNARLILIA